MEVVQCRLVVIFVVNLFIIIMLFPSESLAAHDIGSLAKTQLTHSKNKSNTRQLPWEVVREFIFQITEDTGTPAIEQDVQSSRMLGHRPPMVVISDEKTPNSEEKIVQLLQRNRDETWPVDESEFKSLSLPTMFEDWDLNRDSWIDMEEMANISGTTILNTRAPFLAADLDGDDLINKDEFLMAPWYLNGSDESFLSMIDAQARRYIDQYNQSERNGDLASQPKENSDELEDQPNTDIGLDGSLLSMIDDQTSWYIEQYNHPEGYSETDKLTNTDFILKHKMDNYSYFIGIDNDTDYYTAYIYDTDDNDYSDFDKELGDPVVYYSDTSDSEDKLKNTGDTEV